MSIEYCVVSIGALSHNRLWGESAPCRTAHSTSTYISDGQRHILVDPSLPGPVLAARFAERTGKALTDVTDVFCTTLRPIHRRGIEAISQAKWWASEIELQHYQHHLEQLLGSADHLSVEDSALAEMDLKLIQRFCPAPDKFTEQVSLFPTYGPSPGSTALLLTPSDMTIAIAGDAALTKAHVEHGQVWQGCADVKAAMESLGDLLEIADVLIPGHDELIITPRQRWI